MKMAILPQEEEAFGEMSADRFDRLLQRAVNQRNLRTLDRDDDRIARGEEDMDRALNTSRITCRTGLPVHCFEGE